MLDKKLRDYRKPVAEAKIPMMVFYPTISNDSRRLIITSQPASFLVNSHPDLHVNNESGVESVEFSRLFRNHGAGNVRMTSVIRANATFPYILPNPNLPTEPLTELMDAGVRDNFGMRNLIKYIYTFRNWISSNTSGVIIIQIRDKYKESEVRDFSAQSKIESFLNPVGTFYNNWFSVQDYDHDDLLKYAEAWFDNKLDVIQFQLWNEEVNRISMSWHLTKKEKRMVLNAVNLPENQEAFERLSELLK